MSYDLRVWCVRPLAESNTGTIVCEDDWAVNADGSLAQRDDMPPEVVAKWPQLKYVVDLTLEPISAPEAGHCALWQAAGTIAEEADGVIEDPQSGVVAPSPQMAKIARAETEAPRPRRRGLTMEEAIASKRNQPVTEEARAAAAAWNQSIAEGLRMLEFVLRDLREAGYHVPTHRELSIVSLDRRGLEIVFGHLSRQYPPHIRATLVGLFRRPEARFAWDSLVRMYREEQSLELRNALANMLVALADKQRIGDVIALVQEPNKYDPSSVDTRGILMMALGRSKDDRARAALESLQNDPALGKFATTLLRRKKPRPGKL